MDKYKDISTKSETIFLENVKKNHDEIKKGIVYKRIKVNKKLENEIKNIVKKILGNDEREPEKKDDLPKIPPYLKYDNLLDRIYSFPGMISSKTSENKPIIIPALIGHKEGKYMYITNFSAIYNMINRNKNHVAKYISIETNAPLSLISDDCLKIVCKFSITEMQNIIKKYVQEFVQCSQCKGIDTKLMRNSVERLMEISCTKCSAKRIVRNLK